MKFCPKCGSPLIRKEINGEDRQACKDTECGYVFWGNPVPVVAALLELDSDVLLVRNRGWPEKVFGLVTGFLEQGEDPEDAVLREVGEELGLSGTVKGLIGLYTFQRMNQLIIAYHVIAHGTIALGDELEEAKRISPERLRPWDFGTGLAVRDWLDRRKDGA